MEHSTDPTPAETVNHGSSPKRRRGFRIALALALIALFAFIGNRFLASPIAEIPVDAPPPSAFANFDTCAIDGNPIMESFPAQCRDANGALFVDDVGMFTDTASGIAIAYPIGYRFTEGSDPEFTVGTFFGTPAPTLASVALDAELFRGTNARHAFVTWSIQDDASSDQCAMVIREGSMSGTAMTDGPTIGGIPFREGRTDGAAAGTHVASRILHTELYGRCYEIGMHLVSSNIGNFEPGAVIAVDELRIFALLERVAARTAIARE